MSFYSDASLALIPSGYKNGKVYSALPTDGSGDMSFTRASNATRVASNGLIEKVRESLFTHNTDFTNAVWTKQQTTVVADQVANPVNGAVDADLFYPNGSGTFRAIRRNLSPLVISEVGISIYAKAAGKSILFFNDSGGARQVAFDLSAGTFANTNATAISMEALSGGWYRCSFSANTEMFYMCVSDGTGSSLVTANGTDGIYIWGQQTEYGVPTEFIGVTTTTAVSVGPVSGLPRLDYLNSTCPRLLLEPQRTNVAQFSEQFDNAYWAKQNGTVTANTEAAPDGTTTADTLTSNGGSATANKSCVRKSDILAENSSVHVKSIFLKKGNTRYGWLSSLGASFVNANTFIFDFDDEVITFVDDTSGLIVDTKVIKYPNGWYRFVYTAPTTGSITRSFSVGMTKSPTTIEDHDSGDFIHIWGAQLEAGAYATSYIPTLSTSVTRVADAASKTGISSLIGQTEGTLYAEVDINSTGLDQNIELGNGTNANRINVRLNQNNNFQLVIVQGSVVVFNAASTATFIQGQNLKIAAVYKSGSVTQMFVNGVSVLTGTAGTITGSLSAIFTYLAGSGTGFLNSPVKQILVFPTALTDTQAIELTA